MREELREELKDILDIQEFDMKMIRLMRLKNERLDELKNIESIKRDLDKQIVMKDGEIIEIKKNIRISELEVSEVEEKISKLEAQQSSVKKVEEFNALNQEISSAEREKALKEQRLSDLLDKLATAEDVHKELLETQEQTLESSRILEEEIRGSVRMINSEGAELKTQRDGLAESASSQILKVYERLLRNKKDRVVVPIENRTCSGCHIMLTAQHENLVRKGERLVFCEHCSRILFWPEAPEAAAAEAAGSKRRRRRAVKG